MTLLQIQFAVISRSVRQKAFVFHPISLNVQNPDVQHKPVNTFVSGLPPLSTPCPLPLGRPDTQASNSPARDDVGFGINIRCKYPNLAHPLVSSCCRKEERLFLNVCPTGGNRKEHSKAKTKNTHREPRKFAMLVTETSKRDAASAPISPKKKNAPSVRSRLCGFLLLTFAASRLVEQLCG